MKTKLPLILLALVGVASVLAVPTLARHSQNARRRAAMDVPQAQHELRVPTAQRLNALLPKGSRQILEGSSQITLLSVNPRENYEPNKRTFHRHEILGQTVVAGTEKMALLASLYDGFVPAPSGAIIFGCFNPRHGIRATLDGNTVDLLLCFSCSQFNGYLNDHQFATYEFVGGAPMPKFNQVLTTANVPLPAR